MLIDWSTVVAQLANFLILLALLNKFLFKPVLIAIDVRNKKIAAKLEQAEQEKNKAEQALCVLEAEKVEFEKAKAQMLTEARGLADTERKKLLQEVRKEALDLREHFAKSLEHEQHLLRDEIVEKIEKEVFEGTKKALRELADTSIEERMIDMFVKKLILLSLEQKKALIASLQATRAPMKIRTSFVLRDSDREKIEQAMKEIFLEPFSVLYETDLRGICGIELVTNGYKVRWNVTGYLGEKEQA